MGRRGVLLLLAIALAATRVAAQERDAQVLKPGQFRVFFGAEYLNINSRFEADDTAPLDGSLSGPLTPVTFSPLQPIAADLASLLAETEAEGSGEPVDAADLLAGDLSAEFAWNTRTVPFRLAAGVLPRIEIGIQMPMYRNQRLTQRFDVVGGNVGLNPDSSGNAELLAQISPAAEAFGSASVLPLDGTTLGDEIQQRVFALTGERLMLPEDPLTAPELAPAFGLLRPPGMLSEWRPGDLEIDSRIEVISNLGDGLYPDSTAMLGYRLAVRGGWRFATGRRGEGNPLLEWGPEVGFGGTRLGIAGDLFAGRYVWVSAGGSLARSSTANVRVAVVPEGGPLAGDIELVEGRRKPGNKMDLWIVPRLRLNREMSLGGTVGLERWAAGSEEVEGESFVIPKRSRRFLGFSVRYSSLEGYDERRTRLPIEVSLSFNTTVNGAEGSTADRWATLRFSVLPRFWGRPAP